MTKLGQKLARLGVQTGTSSHSTSPWAVVFETPVSQTPVSETPISETRERPARESDVPESAAPDSVTPDSATPDSATRKSAGPNPDKTPSHRESGSFDSSVAAAAKANATVGSDDARGRGAPASERVEVKEHPLREGSPSHLEELRERIAAILARSAKASVRAEREAVARAEATDHLLPFVEEETPLGPLHLARKKTSPGARVGTAPLHPAILADPTMLALLALDPLLAGCDPKRALYLDTETTGLSGGTGTVAFLLGLAMFDEHAGAFVLEQVFIKRLGEEAPMLEHLARRLEDASMIVTFNGKAFDWPLLRTRAVMNRRPPLRELPHLDLLHVARRIHKARLASCNLRTIEEEVLGSVRIDDVGGADICACYMHYLRTRDASAISGVVEHNAADVLSMVALAGFYGEPVGSLGPRDLASVASTLKRAGALDRANEVVEIAVQRVTDGWSSATVPSTHPVAQVAAWGGRHAEAQRFEKTHRFEKAHRSEAHGVEEAQHGRRTRAAVMRVRGDIAKARGDKARALADYEHASAAESNPSLRLELAKLYEHFEKSFDKALGAISEGTTEGGPAHEKRRARLARRLEIRVSAASTSSSATRETEASRRSPPRSGSTSDVPMGQETKRGSKSGNG